MLSIFIDNVRHAARREARLQRSDTWRNLWELRRGNLSPAGQKPTLVQVETQSNKTLRKQKGRFLWSRVDSQLDQSEVIDRRKLYTLRSQLKSIVFNSWVNVLFIAVPIGITLEYTWSNPTVLFAINFIAIIPSSVMLGYAVDQLAHRLGDVFGSLLSMTFRWVNRSLVDSSY